MEEWGGSFQTLWFGIASDKDVAQARPPALTRDRAVDHDAPDNTSCLKDGIFSCSSFRLKLHLQCRCRTSWQSHNVKEQEDRCPSVPLAVALLEE